MSGQLAIALTAALIVVAVAAVVLAVRTRRVVATPTERAVHTALHTASLAARALRQGLTASSAGTAAPFLRGLTGTDGLALFDGDGRLLARDPDDDAVWDADVIAACDGAARESLSGERRVMTPAATTAVVAQPLLTDAGDRLGVLVVVTTHSPVPACWAPSARWFATRRARSNWPNSTRRALGSTAPRCWRCARRSARTSSTTR